MPVTTIRSPRRIPSLSTAAFPTRLAERRFAAEDEPDTVRALGIEHATEMCRRLIAEETPGPHALCASGEGSDGCPAKHSDAAADRLCCRIQALLDSRRFAVVSGSSVPPFQTVFGFFSRWSQAGVFNLIRDQLRRLVRMAMGASPHGVAVTIDSQSVKAAATVPRSTSGYDPGKKIVDLKGLPLLIMVTPANLHDSGPAKEILFRLRLTHPEVAVVWADSAYAGRLVEWAKTFLNLTIKTVSWPEGAEGFVLLPRRWVIERTWAWLLHARRNARDYETLPQHAEAMLTIAALTLMTHRLTRPTAFPDASTPHLSDPVRAA